jgi:hypothetical protein
LAEKVSEGQTDKKFYEIGPHSQKVLVFKTIKSNFGQILLSGFFVKFSQQFLAIVKKMKILCPALVF